MHASKTKMKYILPNEKSSDAHLSHWWTFILLYLQKKTETPPR
jgi:hypothetical protein